MMPAGRRPDTSSVLDPIVVGAGTGLVASVVGGRAVVFGLESLPEGRRRASEWLFVVGAAVVAVAASLRLDRPGAPVALAFVVAALPGILAYLAWRTVLASALVSLLPLYFAIAEFVRGGTLHAPLTALDRALPAEPAWTLVYASLCLSVLLPVLVVRDRGLLRRTMLALLVVMSIGYVGFLIYPTMAPRPSAVTGDGFAAWGLRLTYALDSPYNCFPSLHVAYSFVSALACYRVNRRVGLLAVLWASLVGVSTLFTKQHYAVDVVVGALMGIAASTAILRGYPREAVSDTDRRLAPHRALVAVGIFGALIAVLWVLYLTGIVAL
jgi:membrane-associated phospholipid phosphatase